MENQFYNFKETKDVNTHNAKDTLYNWLRGHFGAYHIDIRKSKGSYSFFPSHNKLVLDMNMSLASRPLSYNHPIFNSDEYRDLVWLYTANKMAYSTYHTDDFAKATQLIGELYVKPSGFDRLFYIAGGAKAVEVAVHIAIINKVEKNIQAGIKGEVGNHIISLYGDYHGRGLGFRSVTTSIPNKNEYLPHVPVWKTLNPPLSIEEVPDALERLEKMILEIGAENLAGFLSEDMIQCGWGDRYIPAEFFNGLRKLADKYDFYMINDAVQTGMYASGEPFAHQALGAAQPDIVAGCKKSATGYVLVKDKILKVPGNAIDSTISINSTFGGHLPDIITWSYVLKAIEQDNLDQNAKQRGKQFLDGLEYISEKHPSLTNPRGIGLMGLALSAKDGETLGKITNACLENGLLIFPGTTPAPDGYAVRFRPVLDVTEKEVDEVIRILDETLTQLKM